MAKTTLTRQMFLEDTQGRTFADVADDADQPFDAVLAFFNDENRLRRMEESEIHHDRPPLAGVIRELEFHPAINRFLSEVHTKKSNRLRQAIGAMVRMIMESRGWQKTGRKGSLGVRAAIDEPGPKHNTGGLAFWFIRAERYQHVDGMPFQSVRERCREHDEASNKKSGSAKSAAKKPAAKSSSSDRGRAK